MIVVTGATGTIGSELIHLLSEAGEEVRALSRHPPDESPVPGVEWREADLSDRASLESAFDGAQRLFLLTGNAAEMVQAQKNAIEAAASASTERVVKLSALGASDHSKSVIGVWHWVVEQVLREADVEWTILRPHVFMQNVLDQRAAIREPGTVRSPSGDAAIPMIDTRDIAAAAAAVLIQDGHAGERYTLTGPEPVSWHEIARILSDLLGRSVEYVPETEDDTWDRLHSAGEPPWLIAGRLALAEYQRAGGGTDIVTDAVERLTGRRPRSFREFAEDHAPDLG